MRRVVEHASLGVRASKARTMGQHLAHGQGTGMQLYTFKPFRFKGTLPVLQAIISTEDMLQEASAAVAVAAAVTAEGATTCNTAGRMATVG